MSFSIHSGEIITVTGWYKYDGHIDSGVFDCFIPMQSSRMLFKKGESCMSLGSCSHKIRWKFIEAYS